ncbi:MAG: hypothetical protein RIC35_16065 [Marinoscillum sp.]
MPDSYNKWERFYHRLNLIFNGIVAITLIPFAFIFLETQTDFPDPPAIDGSMEMVVKVLLIVLAAAIIGLAQVYAKKSLISVQQTEGLGERLNAYLKVKVRSYAILEFAALLACLGLFLTKDQIFSFVYVFVLFIFSLGRPTFERVAREVKVSEKKLKEWGEASI